jgi:hypothetical protein
MVLDISVTELAPLALEPGAVMVWAVLAAESTKAAASWTACLASAALSTEPERTTKPVDQALKVETALLDGHVEGDDLPTGAVEDDDVGLTVGEAGDVDLLRRTDHRVCDRRVGDQDVARVARQRDDL